MSVFLMNILLLILDISCTIPIFGKIMDSTLSLALLRDAMVVLLTKTHHNHGPCLLRALHGDLHVQHHHTVANNVIQITSTLTLGILKL